MKPKGKEIVFKAIPGVKDGHTCLTIYPPGQFIENKDYAVFVGGCGVGHVKTLKEAKTLLLEKAIATCQHRISEASAVVTHYQKELERLLTDGLEYETRS